MSNRLGTFSDRMSSWMEVLAGIALIGVMLLIVADIIGRKFGFPVPGAYEIVSIMGGLIVGLALPATTRAKGHVSADLLLAKLPQKPRLFLTVATRVIGMAVFMLAGWGMVMMGIRLKMSGEVTAVLALPFYYVAYAIGGALVVQTLVLFAEAVEMINHRS
jgi:TRAP-type C4-dicarboxylate transport system permease small subunit